MSHEKISVLRERLVAFRFSPNTVDAHSEHLSVDVSHKSQSYQFLWSLLAYARKTFLFEVGMIVITYTVFSLFTSGFWSVENLRAILVTASITGIIAVTATLVTMSGNFFSLSTSASAILGAVMFVSFVAHGWNIALAAGLVLFTATACGVFQGIIVAGGLNPIIATLAVGYIIIGVVSAVSHNETVIMYPHSVSYLGIGRIGGIPYVVIYFILITVLVTFISSKMVLGRETLLSGANRMTAEVSGINFKRVTIWAFAIAGLGAGIAGILTGAQLGIANTTLFSTTTFDVVAAILVGGTAIHGGNGSPMRSAYGAVLISIIHSAMLIHQLPGGTQMAFEGGLALIVIIFLQSPVLRKRQL